MNSDSYNIVPVEVDSLVIYAGERFDFVLKANRSINNYWMHFQGLLDCDERFQSVFQMAILRYANYTSVEEPKGLISYHRNSTNNIELNSLNMGSGIKGHPTVAELKAEINNDTEASVADDILFQEVDYKFYIYYDMYIKDNPVYHPSHLYGINDTLAVHGRVVTPQLNHITFEYPLKPLLDSRFPLDDSHFCNESSFIEQDIDCKTEFCKCEHVLQVSLNSIVEIIIVDEGFTYDTNHPFHLHGSAFRVLAVDRIGRNVSIETVCNFNYFLSIYCNFINIYYLVSFFYLKNEKIKKLDKENKIKRNLQTPPIKDSITVPDGGYTIIRFRATNPGFWLFHCHLEFHTEMGMSLILKVGTNKEMPKTPKDFPTCTNYLQSPDLNIFSSKKFTQNGSKKCNNINSFLLFIILNISFLLTKIIY